MSRGTTPSARDAHRHRRITSRAGPRSAITDPHAAVTHERGIRSFCVTIDRQGADYLPRLYGPARYEVVPNAYRLPMRMAEIYRHLTT